MWINNPKIWGHLNPIIRYYAEILKRQDISADLRTIDQVISSYSGSINKYLLATGFYVADKVSNNKLTAKNEYPDINHLMHVDGGDTIVTNDDLIHKLHDIMNIKDSAIWVEV